MSKDIGAAVMERRFLRRKSCAERVTSESVPRRKVRKERERPMIVRYWKCQPYWVVCQGCRTESWVLWWKARKERSQG